MKIALLTSSRADYGIYRPLIKRIAEDHFFDLNIVVFGTHLSEFYGFTKNEIINDGYEIYSELRTMPEGDKAYDIGQSISKTIAKFTEFWDLPTSKFDLIIVLGDRYEMAAAAISTIAFNLKLAHIHGGEVTEGAIDNTFRNMITEMAEIHFTTAAQHFDNVARIKNSNVGVYNVGALGLENIKNIKLLNKEEFDLKFNIKLDNPILTTIHPETKNIESNLNNVEEYIKAILQINDQLIITLPNADTMGLSIREKLMQELSHRPNTYLVESFGTQGYFSCMHHCSFLLGNTSSGIIEAASFNKYVINLGSRQEGRLSNLNIINCDFDQAKILQNISEVKAMQTYTGENLYGKGNTSKMIVDILKSL